MKIDYFLLPKEEVTYIKLSANMRQALDMLEQHYYSAMPVIDDEGKYVGTLNEGDLLWKMKNTPGLNFENMHEVPISEIEMHVHNISVSINAEMEDMLALAAAQNFVPVMDNNDIFLGIIRRKDIIAYYVRNITD
jgi:CBS-domain-containing membrane protein